MLFEVCGFFFQKKSRRVSELRNSALPPLLPSNRPSVQNSRLQVRFLCKPGDAPDPLTATVNHSTLA